MMRVAQALFTAGFLAALTFGSDAALADFRGKNMSVQIGYGAGGGYDAYGRLLARHMGKHIPGNPTLIPKNMPGAGSLKLANYLYVSAPKDGSEFGIIGNGVILEPLLDGTGAQFDPRKFSWIGSLDKFVEIGVVWHASRVQTIEGAMKEEMVVGALGSKDGTLLYPVLLNSILGTKFKIVKGYNGTRDMTVAVERGELDGFLGWCTSCILSARPDWLEEKKAKIFIQLALEKDPRFPDVPTVMDYITKDEDRQLMALFFSGAEMSRPFVAPPGVPKDRLSMLRQAFEATVNDADMLAEAQKMNLDINLTKGERIDAIVRANYEFPHGVIAKASEIFKQN